MIWCVEDDENIRELEIYSLQAAGFETRGFDNGSAFWEALQTESPRLVLLDIMLPGIDGIELLKRMRAEPHFMRIPVIMATVIGGEAHKARGLDAGADDYLVKPFSMIEMTARVRAVLRRVPEAQEPPEGIHLDQSQHLATLNGRPLELTYKEFKLLELFLARPGIAFSRDQLLEIVWGEDYFRETRTVDVHIRSLRRKLGSWAEHIETVRNVGYRLKREIC